MKKYKLKGSITVESALVLPLFIFVILFFCFFFRLMELQFTVQKAINQASRELASYGYVLNRAESLTEAKKTEMLSEIPMGEEALEYLMNFADDYVAKLIVSRYLDSHLIEKYRVVGGWKGVSFSGTDLRDEDDCLTIQVTYRISLPFFSRIAPELTVKQCAATGLFSGRLAGLADEEQSEDTVYVAKNGTVYHTSLLCTHLKLTIKEVKFNEVKNLRNHNGGKYYACEYCAKKKKKPETVFITVEGDCYHYRQDCIGLRRTVTEQKLSEVKLPLCSRCRDRMQNLEKEE